AKEKAEAEAKAEAAKQSLLDNFSLTKVEFKSGKTELTSKSKKLLDETAKKMIDNSNYRYHISGHTDNIGNDEYNIKLSANRAKEVKSYLILQGVDGDLLTTEGLGSLQPIATNDTKEGRFLNRRVEFKIVE
ncbi:MAG TPA: OmpA family protein, partial [Sulfurovum sp.]|nr:OmpA family protein [Sulfurovum sp.]